jgi:hypothetical protein
MLAILESLEEAKFSGMGARVPKAPEEPKKKGLFRKKPSKEELRRQRPPKQDLDKPSDIKGPKHGFPSARAAKHFIKTAKHQRTMMRVAHQAKRMGRPDAAKLAVQKAREAGAELHGHREMSRARHEKVREAAVAKAGALAKLRQKGSKVRAKVQKVVLRKRRAA